MEHEMVRCVMKNKGVRCVMMNEIAASHLL